MNANLYIPSKASYALYEVAIAKASDQQLIEISNELVLGLSLQEMKKHPSLLQGGRQKPNRRGTANH